MRWKSSRYFFNTRYSTPNRVHFNRLEFYVRGTFFTSSVLFLTLLKQFLIRRKRSELGLKRPRIRVYGQSFFSLRYNDCALALVFFPLKT